MNGRSDDTSSEEQQQQQRHSSLESTQRSVGESTNAATVGVDEGSSSSSAQRQSNNYISANIVVDATDPSSLMIPMQSVRYHIPGSTQPATVVMGPTAVSATLFPVDQLHQGTGTTMQDFRFHHVQGAHEGHYPSPTTSRVVYAGRQDPSYQRGPLHLQQQRRSSFELQHQQHQHQHSAVNLPIQGPQHSLQQTAAALAFRSSLTAEQLRSLEPTPLRVEETARYPPSTAFESQQLQYQQQQQRASMPVTGSAANTQPVQMPLHPSVAEIAAALGYSGSSLSTIAAAATGTTGPANQSTSNQFRDTKPPAVSAASQTTLAMATPIHPGRDAMFGSLPPPSPQNTVASIPVVRPNAAPLTMSPAIAASSGNAHLLTGSTHPNQRLDKMLKPLTAYNYFYRDERDNIVKGMSAATDPMPNPVSDFSEQKYEALLHQHWYEDPKKVKRQHRKVHGVIDFPTLSKVIAVRWKQLPESGRDFYRRVARADQEKYDDYISRGGL